MRRRLRLCALAAMCGAVAIGSTVAIGAATSPPPSDQLTTIAADLQAQAAKLQQLAGDLSSSTTTTAVATTSTTAPTSSSTTTTVPAGLLFADEFDGTALDLTKWQPNWLGSTNATVTKPVNGSELSCYDPSQVTEPGDGFLHLDAAIASPACTASNGTSYNYRSGLVNSRAHFTFTYGTITARIWTSGAGAISNWPAFWADGTGTWPTTGENDVFEGLNGKPCFHFHSPSGGPGGCAPSNGSGWHTYAATWAPGTVTYRYDGAQVGQITSGITGAPMYLILNLGISEPGHFGGPLEVPATMLVDWVRVTR